ncbi:MAG: AraC family transcriptional regulator [Roseibium sp.]
MNVHTDDLPLSANMIVRTTDPEEAVEFANSAISLMSVAFRRPISQFEFQLAGGQLGTLEILSMEQHIPGGSDVTVDGSEDEYLVEVPLLGATTTQIGNESNPIARNQYGFVHSPSDRVIWRDDGFRYRCLQLKIKGAVLRKRLSHYVGDSSDMDIKFAPFVDLMSPEGAHIVSMIWYGVEMLEQRNSIFQNSVNAILFEEFLANVLLTTLPHSASSLLQRPVLAAAEPAIKRVVEYIVEHLDEQFSVAELADIAGVSVRSLQRSFQQRYNLSPLRFIRDKRLDRARIRLLSSEGMHTVSQIAFASGFTHLGAFGSEYKRRFGETPSQTLSRQR